VVFRICSPAAEIIVSTAPRYLPHYTVADHAAWEGDWELLDGVALAMTPSPFWGRQAATNRCPP
jgi:hypothetical protein